MIAGFIIAAGKQTRFDSDIPKALAEYNGRTLLEHNYNLMSKYCNDIYIVCSSYNYKYFEKYPIKKIVLDTVKGCGDSIFRALRYYIADCLPSLDTSCIIHWGDSIQTEDVYKSLSFECNDMVGIQVPCSIENNPYVIFDIHNTDIIKSVRFSKFKEIENFDTGYHDCSLFYGNLYYVYNCCEKFVNTYYKNDDYADFGHGKEFNFLDIFNKISTIGIVKNVLGELPKAFNTIDELKNLGGSV